MTSLSSVSVPPAADGRLRSGSRRGPIAASLAGVACIGLAVALLGMPRRDALVIAAIALAAATLTTIVGAGLLYAIRQWSIGAQAGVVALLAVTGAGLGAWGTAAAMFVSAHDFTVLLAVLVTAGVASSLSAGLLGWRVSMAAGHLVDVTRAIDGSAPVSITVQGHPTELGVLGRELQAMSDRLRSAQQRNTTLERSRRELVAWVSTDLQAIAAGIEKLAYRAEDAETLQREVESMHRLVGDLLDLNKGPSST